MKWKIIIITGIILLVVFVGVMMINKQEVMNYTEERNIQKNVLETDEGLLIDNIEELRTESSIEEINGIEKDFNSIDKTITITDLNTGERKSYKLLSDYKQYVSYGNDTWIAEVEVDLTLSNSNNLFDKIEFYNKDYQKTEKQLKYKYKTLWNESTNCTKVKGQEICNIEEKANWTEFKSISELPSKKAIIGIFTDVEQGEKGEWIATIDGIKIYEFAEFSAVTSWNTNINLGTIGDINYFDNFLWLIDALSDKIYKFYTNGTRFGNSSIALPARSWEGVAVIGNYAYLLDGQSGTDEVYIWNYPGWTDTYTHWDTRDADDARSMIAYDGLLWILDAKNDEVYKFYPNGTYTGIHFDCGTAGAGTPQGITTNGTFIWILDSVDDEVYKFYMNGTYTNLKFDISSQNTNGIGITNNGTHFFIVDANDNAYVYDMGIGSEEEPTSCASYQNGQWYIPTGCQCYCDHSTGETMNLNECICEETI